MKRHPPAIRKLIVDSPRKCADRRYARGRSPSQASVVEAGLRVPMADGIQLAAMLWRPKRQGKYPALVERVPYPLQSRTGSAGEYYAARGFAVIGVSLRGRGGSEGKFSGPMPGTPTGDGYATIEWVARQPWCNGRIGMICGSYSGFTQYQTAVEAPPHLDALLVREGVYDAYWYPGGAGVPWLVGLAANMTRQDLEHYPPAKISVIFFTSPLWGVLLSIVILDEPFSPRLLIGGVLVAVGILLVNRKKRLNRQQPSK